MKTAIFCDFDGTVTRRDVGYSIFHHFSGGKNDELLPDWKAGRMTTRECLTREAAMVRASTDELYRFIDLFELDAGFLEFARLCRKNDIPLMIASDGLDFYIRHILGKYDLGHLMLPTNVGRAENGGLTVEFPHRNRSCPRCGTCKGERIEQFREDHGGRHSVVFVGDGYSDACAAHRADIIFAKKDLERYCQAGKIAYLKFDTFDDVSRQLIQMNHLER
ncbi:MAG: MtnX-like HAD-IB family phosphatase [Candidatus Zixiibacteriota bacterium]|nr:MAG: MtnX-like HAD-IB family phosphatase [candidate division Zixibacteria bacterium]